MLTLRTNVDYPRQVRPELNDALLLFRSNAAGKTKQAAAEVHNFATLLLAVSREVACFSCYLDYVACVLFPVVRRPFMLGTKSRYSNSLACSLLPVAASSRAAHRFSRPASTCATCV